MICFHVNLKEGMHNIDFFQLIPNYNLLLMADANKITKSFPFLCFLKKLQTCSFEAEMQRAKTDDLL